MKRQIILHNRVINYSVRKSNRAKRMRLTIYCDGNFIVTIPKTFPANSVDKYVIAKSQWVISKLDFFKELNRSEKIKVGEDGYLKYKNQAFKTISDRVASFNSTYKFKFNKFTIKNQKTRWGSCSKKRNLNFNYKTLFLSPELRDYIVVHELCHLKEFNHSKKFWNLVAKTIPNYKDVVNDLKMKGLSLQ